MLKKIGLSNLVLNVFRTNDNEFVTANDGIANETVINLSNKLKNNKSRNLMYVPNIKAMRKSIFLIFNAKKVFNYLKQVFTKPLILQYFNLKNHIWIEINALSYAISGVLS